MRAQSAPPTAMCKLKTQQRLFGKWGWENGENEAEFPGDRLGQRYTKKILET